MGSPPNGLISQSWVWFVCHVLMGWHAAAWCLAKPYWRCNTNWKTTISCQNGVGCVCSDNQARAGRVGLSGSGCVAESVSQQGLQLGEEWKGGEGAAAHWERAPSLGAGAKPAQAQGACAGAWGVLWPLLPQGAVEVASEAGLCWHAGQATGVAALGLAPRQHVVPLLSLIPRGPPCGKVLGARVSGGPHRMRLCGLALRAGCCR